jgi:hypothetical protein
MTRNEKTGRLQMIIREFAFSFARATGTEPTRDQIKAVETDLCAHFGGERFYVPAAPKAITQARIATAIKNGAKTKREISLAAGVNRSTVQRYRCK